LYYYKRKDRIINAGIISKGIMYPEGWINDKHFMPPVFLEPQISSGCQWKGSNEIIAEVPQDEIIIWMCKLLDDTYHRDLCLPSQFYRLMGAALPGNPAHRLEVWRGLYHRSYDLYTAGSCFLFAIMIAARFFSRLFCDGIVVPVGIHGFSWSWEFLRRHLPWSGVAEKLQLGKLSN